MFCILFMYYRQTSQVSTTMTQTRLGPWFWTIMLNGWEKNKGDWKLWQCLFLGLYTEAFIREGNKLLPFFSSFSAYFFFYPTIMHPICLQDSAKTPLDFYLAPAYQYICLCQLKLLKSWCGCIHNCWLLLSWHGIFLNFCFIGLFSTFVFVFHIDEQPSEICCHCLHLFHDKRVLWDFQAMHI